MRTTARLVLAVMCAIGVSCTAPPNTTDLQIHAPGESGATVSYADESVVLDPHGDGVLTVPRLHVITSGFGTSTAFALVDREGRLVSLHVVRGTGVMDLHPQCFPVDTDGGEVDVVELRLQRQRTDGACWLSNPAVLLGGTRRTGDYDPSRFDDAACGPFR